MSAFEHLLEAKALEAGSVNPTLPLDAVANLSAAISLKRIADTLDGSSGGLTIAQAVEQAISTGMFHGFQNDRRAK